MSDSLPVAAGLGGGCVDAPVRQRCVNNNK